MGRSGSGKSTLLNLIGGLDVVSSGELFILGQALGKQDETQRAILRRNHMGIVFQFFNLIPTLTVAENLSLPLALIGITGLQAEQACMDWLQRVGLGNHAQRYPEEISGGEQQRVAIARALIHDPQIILADEPTGNLDLDTAKQILTLLDQLCRECGKTLVMATHSQEVIGLADRVLTIRDGALIEGHL